MALAAVLMLLLSPAAARAADWANIVMYHRFGEATLPSTSIRMDQFRAHLDEIEASGLTVMDLEKVIAAFESGEELPDRALAITIDDAYLSVYEKAWPLLREAGYPFTLFVSTEAVDRELPGYMTWDQIRELANAGVTIGNQSVTHPHLVTLEKGRVISEIAGASRRIEDETGTRPALFAYPFGEFSNSVKAVVEDVGFKAAFGQHSGVAYAQADRYALPRFPMNEKYGGIGRFKMASTALPLKVADVTPTDNLLRRNPPNFGFSVAGDVDNLRQIACFASNTEGPAKLERLGARRIEVRIDAPFPPGRGRINCTVPGPESRWRWFGVQFYIPGN
jgi:peptidoglycan/xylan/chitin deacetylase (PgdA/CDA1 family)